MVYLYLTFQVHKYTLKKVRREGNYVRVLGVIHIFRFLYFVMIIVVFVIKSNFLPVGNVRQIGSLWF